MRARGLVEGVAGAGALGVLACFGLAGAASRPGGGMLLALPGVSVCLLAVGLLVAVAKVGGRVGLLRAAPFAAVPLLWLVAPGLSGVKALSGPPVLALAAAVAVGAVAGGTPAVVRIARRLFLPVLIVVYGVVAARVQSRVGPEGDEPHYLIVADSLLRHRTLDVRQEFEEGAYRAFHPAPLEPHFRVRGRNDEIYSIHALGLSLLVLPAYALGGYKGASFFMAFLAVLLGLEMRGLLRAWLDDERVSEGAAWAFALSPPLIHYSGLVFTEVPAALLLTYASRRAGEEGATRGRILTWSAVLALLPWLNVRYALLPVVVFAYFLCRRPRLREVAAALLPLAASAAALALYHFVLYGFLDPRRVYGRHREFSTSILPEGLSGLFLDQEFGLLVYAPLFALALPGLVRLLRARPREGALTLGLASVVVVTAGSWDMWRGGFNPPARFLVPLVPLLAAAAAFELKKGLGAAACVLIGWGLFTGLVGGVRPDLVHRDRDGTAPFFRVESGASEWTSLLPGYVLHEPDRKGLALLWALALGAAVLPWPAPKRTAARYALATLGLIAAASLASRMSLRRSEGRDAVRTIGRGAILLPGVTFEAEAAAVWTPDDTGWGSLYEPQKFPGGALLGGRLPLPPGRYSVEVSVDPKIPLPGTPPDLLVLGVRRHVPEPLLRHPLQEAGDRLQGEFQVAPEEDDVTLRLDGGGPAVVREVRLLSLPPARAGVLGEDGAAGVRARAGEAE